MILTGILSTRRPIGHPHLGLPTQRDSLRTSFLSCTVAVNYIANQKYAAMITFMILYVHVYYLTPNKDTIWVDDVGLMRLE